MGDDSITTTDGTLFMLDSEHVRGEPRWYFVSRRLPNERESQSVWDGGPDGSVDKRTVLRRMRRAAREHEEATS
jgi:hypothetical protein